MPPTTESILSKLSGISFNDLLPEEKQYLALLLRPQPGQPFTEEQRTFLADWYFVVPADRLAELEVLNAGRNNIAQPVELIDGTKVLPTSLLSDVREGETFAHLRDFLFSLAHRNVTAADWTTNIDLI